MDWRKLKRRGLAHLPLTSFTVRIPTHRLEKFDGIIYTQGISRVAAIDFLIDQVVRGKLKLNRKNILKLDE